MENQNLQEALKDDVAKWKKTWGQEEGTAHNDGDDQHLYHHAVDHLKDLGHSDDDADNKAEKMVNHVMGFKEDTVNEMDFFPSRSTKSASLRDRMLMKQLGRLKDPTKPVTFRHGSMAPTKDQLRDVKKEEVDMNIAEDNPRAEPIKVGNKVLRQNKDDKDVRGVVTKVTPDKVHVKYGSNTVAHDHDDFDSVYREHNPEDYKKGFRHYTYHSNDGINEGYLYEDWNKGSSSSYWSDSGKAIKHLRAAQRHLRDAKSSEPGLLDHAVGMYHYHKHMAAFEKHGYHGEHPEAHTDMKSAKKAAASHTEAAKQFAKTVREAGLSLRSEEYKEEIELGEDSLAMQTLKAGSRPVSGDPKSKIEAITSVIGAMHSMRKDDLTKWYKQAMDLVGKEASHLPGSANERSNEASLNMKPSHAVGKGGASANDAMPKLDHKNNPLAAISVKEDVEEMFEGQDLSEEFKEKASTLFEAAVQAKAMTVIAQIEEEYETRLEEEVESISESLQESLDKYLDYVIERWMEENEVAIESSLRNEVMEEFIDGMKNLFAEHYMEMPEDKVDVIEALADKVEELEHRLDEAIVENGEMREVMLEAERMAAIEEVSEGLTMTQSEKFAALSEGIEFSGDIDAYKRKLSIVKENYFKKASTTVVDIDEEYFEGEQPVVRTASYDPNVNRYASAISRTIKSKTL